MSVPVVESCACCKDDLIVTDATVFDTELVGHVCDECKWHIRRAVAELKLNNIRGCVAVKGRQ